MKTQFTTLAAVFAATLANAAPTEHTLWNINDAPAGAAGATGAELAEPRVTKWKDGKRGAFMLSFDDSCDTHVTKAIPELVKRNLVGTFYINPGGGHYKMHLKEWEEKIPHIPQVVIANHTFLHKGAPDLATVEEDIVRCKEVIDRVFSGGRGRRLLSFGQPGGVPWNITKEETAALLAKYDLVMRPPFFGFPIHITTEEQTLALVDLALEKGDLRYNVFHGVGGDWLSMPMDIYTKLLDKLVENLDKLWITDSISYHKYVTQRDSAKLTHLPGSTPENPWLGLDIATNPELYDLPLTVEIPMPPTAGTLRITQTFDDTTPPATITGVLHDGVLRFDATPRKSTLRISE